MSRLRSLILACSLLVLLCSLIATPTSQASEGSAPRPIEGFVAVRGVRLQYLDYGGSGQTLILIHGLGDNPYDFDDLAPAFTDRFHVLAYARRGSGSSDVKGPFDVETLTEDLRGLMDALGVVKADLVGHSSGGDEITEMAAEHPERVRRIIYLDGAYDWSDPDFHAAYNSLPLSYFQRPASAMASLEAFRSYAKLVWYNDLDDMRRVEARLRGSVVVQTDGSLKDRVPKEIVGALYASLWVNKRRDYARVQCPALAIYAEHLYDVHSGDLRWRSDVVAYERKYWLPFQAKSVDLIRRELANVEIVRSPGTHLAFFLTDRPHVVGVMRRFLGESPQTE